MPNKQTKNKYQEQKDHLIALYQTHFLNVKLTKHDILKFKILKETNIHRKIKQKLEE